MSYGPLEQCSTNIQLWFIHTGVHLESWKYLYSRRYSHEALFIPSLIKIKLIAENANNIHNILLFIATLLTIHAGVNSFLLSNFLPIKI